MAKVIALTQKPLIILIDADMKEQAGEDEDMEDEEKKDSIKE